MFSLDKVRQILDGFGCELEYLITMDYFIESITGLDTLTHVSELTNLRYQDFEIIGHISINKVLVTIGDNKHHQDEYIFFMKKVDQPEDAFDQLYVSVYYSNPLYWYILDSEDNLRDQLENIIDIYNMDDIEDHPHLNKEVYAYMGSNQKLFLNPRAIMSRLIISPFSEGFVWGPKYKDFPINRKIFSQLPLDVQYSEMTKIMAPDGFDDEIDDDESRNGKIPFIFSTKSMFSKSIIKFIDYHGIYIGRFKYRPCKVPNPALDILNKQLKRSYPKDFPIDLVIAIEYYPFLDYVNVLDKIDPNNLCMIITRMIPPERNDLIKDVGQRLRDMILEENLKTKPDLETLYHLETFRKHCASSAENVKPDDQYMTSYKKILKDREKRKEKHLADSRLYVKKLIYRTIQAECGAN